MASSTTAAEHRLSAPSLMTSSSSVSEDDDLMNSSLYGQQDAAAANKRRKQTKPIRFSSVTNPSEENGGARADVLDLTAKVQPSSSSSATGPAVKHPKNGATTSGAAVLDLCVKAQAENSLKPHNDNNGDLSLSSRKRRISGSGNGNRKPISVVEQLTCTLCNMSFSTRILLQKHMKDSHGVTLPDQPAQLPSKPKNKPKSKPRPSTGEVVTHSSAPTNNTNEAAMAAFAQALLMPGSSGSTASTQASLSTSTSALNPALAMLLPNPLAGMFPPESINKLLQAYQMGTSNSTAAAPSSTGASPPTSSSPALFSQQNHTNQTGRSNPTPPSSSGRSSPHHSGDAGWENGTESSPNVNMGHLPLLGFDEAGMEGTKPADSLLRSTVAARMADRVECDICHKQVCNKYFLKSHKLKIHGIVTNEASGLTTSGNKKSASPSPALISATTNNETTAGQQPAIDLLNSLPGLFPSPAVKNDVSTNSLNVSGTNENSHKQQQQQQRVKGEDVSKNLFAASALLRSQSPASQVAAAAAAAVNAASVPPTSSGIDLSVRRGSGQQSFVSPANSQQGTPAAFPPGAYMPPMPAMPPGGIPPPGWRPGSTWRWKETSSISRVTCDICGKELCNKYFLRTHKQNRHGIKDETKSVSDTPHGKKKISHAPSAVNNNSSNNNNSNNNDAFAGGSDSMASTVPLFSSEGLSGLLEQPKVETTRCRCSECGKQFLSPIVYRHHMALCHNVAVLIGKDVERLRQSQRPGSVVTKLKRLSRHRSVAQNRRAVSREQSAASQLSNVGVDNVADEAVTFQIVAANSSGDEATDVENVFDLPQALGVFLKKQLNIADLPSTMTLTLKLQERKSDSYKPLRPAYTRNGELVAVPSSGLEMLTNRTMKSDVEHQPDPMSSSQPSVDDQSNLQVGEPTVVKPEPEVEEGISTLQSMIASSYSGDDEQPGDASTEPNSEVAPDGSAGVAADTEEDDEELAGSMVIDETAAEEQPFESQ